MIEQDPAEDKLQDPVPVNSPLLSELKLTVPVGLVGVLLVSVTVAVQDEPWLITTGLSQVRLVDVGCVVGEDAMTVRSNVAVLVSPPEAEAVIVTVTGPPIVAVELAVKVRVLEHGTVQCVGENDAVTPEGSVDVENVTSWSVPAT